MSLNVTSYKLARIVRCSTWSPIEHDSILLCLYITLHGTLYFVLCVYNNVTTSIPHMYMHSYIWKGIPACFFLCIYFSALGLPHSMKRQCLLTMCNERKREKKNNESDAVFVMQIAREKIAICYNFSKPIHFMLMMHENIRPAEPISVCAFACVCAQNDDSYMHHVDQLLWRSRLYQTAAAYCQYAAAIQSYPLSK